MEFHVWCLCPYTFPKCPPLEFLACFLQSSNSFSGLGDLGTSRFQAGLLFQSLSLDFSGLLLEAEATELTLTATSYTKSSFCVFGELLPHNLELCELYVHG